MTPEQHNKVLAYAHLGFAGAYALLVFLFLFFFGAAFFLSSRGNDGAPLFLMLVMWLFIAAVYAVMIIPSFFAGFGLLKKRKWARTASIIAGVVSAMQFPMGTAVCVYTFWFLFSEPGRAIFDQPNFALPPHRQTWASDYQQRQDQAEYAPPPTPPDWR